MYYGQFPPKSRLKLRFVLFQTWESRNSAGDRDPCCAGNSLSFEKDKSQFQPTCRWKLNLIKSWYLRKNIIFLNFHFLTPLPLLYLKRGEPNTSKIVSNHSIYHTHQYVLSGLCTVYLSWVRGLIQMSYPDSSELELRGKRNCASIWVLHGHFTIESCHFG